MRGQLSWQQRWMRYTILKPAQQRNKIIWQVSGKIGSSVIDQCIGQMTNDK